ncbi:ABC transporter permease [Kineosporia babensis]|uniref:FtsX-like permease family protein n=1 Tax=Kineosporia babensis TaxID=499548 RepID=A0A9X1NIQ0_9ACTN|nr:ABC transporter permease [Kineosporia babensis]MCD5314549.1 FtsX-like permease family protein [Kineosporia babensis]
MGRVALSSLRARATTFGAYFLSVFCGAVLIGAFATLNSAGAGDVSDADAERLLTMGSIVGGWGSAIVLFSLASTLTLIVAQRTAETSLLRSVGATPKQVRRLVLTESTLVTLLAVVLAAGPAWLIGEAILALLRNAEMLADDVRGYGQPVALAITGVVITVVAYLAGRIATRRVTRASVRATQRSAAIEPQRMNRWRLAAGLLLIVGGVHLAVITMTVMADEPDPIAPMSTAGPAGVLTTIGIATLSPLLLRWAAAGFGWVLAPFGVSGHLALHDLRARAQVLGTALAPITIFTGISAGTAYLIAIDNQASLGQVRTPEAEDVQLLNFVVVGMIALFAAIMVVNTLAAAVSARRQEFGRQQLAGATRRQVQQMMLLEAGFLSGAGIVLGGIGALPMACSYSWVRQDSLVPDMGPWYFLAVAVIAAAVTIGASVSLTRKALAPPALTLAAVQAV